MHSFKVIALIVITSALFLSTVFVGGSVVLAVMILTLGALGVAETVNAPVSSNAWAFARPVLVLLRVASLFLVLTYAVIEFRSLGS